jgi:hypothetical protein
VRSAGFSGFKKIRRLRFSDFSIVPDDPGIYLVVCNRSYRKKFLEKSLGGHFKKRDPTVPTCRLEASWVRGTAVLYIGQAGGGKSNETLRKRLKSYIRFGSGEPTAHWGGRLIWQLSDCDVLLVCWKRVLSSDPLEVEARLIREFKAVYSTRPFANLRG